MSGNCIDTVARKNDQQEELAFTPQVCERWRKVAHLVSESQDKLPDYLCTPFVGTPRAKGAAHQARLEPAQEDHRRIQKVVIVGGNGADISECKIVKIRDLPNWFGTAHHGVPEGWAVWK